MKIPEPSPTEWDLIHDESHIAEHGRPRARPSAEGTEAMRARLLHLANEKRKLLDVIDANSVKYSTNETYAADMDAYLDQINRELITTSQRLSSYENEAATGQDRLN
jgi:hypothetical protein